MSLNRIKLEQHFNYYKKQYPAIANYRLVYDNAKTRFGQCRHSRKEISISRYHIQGSTWDEILDTLLHEIAHAITRQRYGREVKGHGSEWKKVCIEIGAKPNRTSDKFSNEKPATKYTLYCSCGFTAHRHRVSSRGRYSCPKCAPGRFDANYLLSVKTNY